MIKPGDRFQVVYIPDLVDVKEYCGKYQRDKAKECNEHEKKTARQFKHLVFFCVARTGNPPCIQAYSLDDKEQKAVFTFRNLKILKKV
jgi:hypothetical protein